MPGWCDYQTFVEIVLERKGKGLLFPKQDEAYPINPQLFDRWLSKHEGCGDKDIRTFAQVIRKHTHHVSWKEFYETFKTTLSKFVGTYQNNARLKRRNYVILTEDDPNKSSSWLSCLFVYHLETDYKDFPKPEKIYFGHQGAQDLRDLVVVFDDASYSGSYLERVITDGNIPMMDIAVVVPYITRNATSVLETARRNCADKKKSRFYKAVYQGDYCGGKMFLITGVKMPSTYELWPGKETLDRGDIERINGSVRNAFLTHDQHENEHEYDIMTCVPWYFDHKIADAVSSYPTIYASGVVASCGGNEDITTIVFIDNCAQVPVEKSVLGTQLRDGCAEPFYKEPMGGGRHKKKTSIKKKKMSGSNQFNVQGVLKRKLAEARERLDFPYIDMEHRTECQKPNTVLKATTGKTSITLAFPQLRSNPLTFGPVVFADRVGTIDMYFNNYNKKVSQALMPSIDMEWFEKSNAYIKTLEPEDIYCISVYTNGNEMAKMINNILRKGAKPDHSIYKLVLFQAIRLIKAKRFDPQKYILADDTVEMSIDDILPYGEYTVTHVLDVIRKVSDEDITERFYKNGQAKHTIAGLHYWDTFPVIGKYLNERFWMEATALYVKRLENIILKSPPVTQDMLLFRGIEENYFQKQSRNFVHTDKGIVSTSLSPKVFTFKGCHKLVLTLLPGSKALFVGGLSGWGMYEVEVLLPPGTSYLLKSGVKTTYVYLSDEHAKMNVCGKAAEVLYVTEAIVL